ncbi:MAG: hypothetical protein F4090_00780 [Nitrospira sp. SB0672_bin_25]|nr:hypothetical protein [Nitrospira sp. SB0672_bin_25]
MAVGVIAVLTAAGIVVRYWVHAHLNVWFCLLSLFFSTNLLICYWETCLIRYFDLIRQRAGYWRQRREETGRSPFVEFLKTEIPLIKVLSPQAGADMWAFYTLYDESYTDKRTYGFNIDIANGFFTLVPTLILYSAFAVAFLPAHFAGILGVMLFWQWEYATSVYMVSFYVAGRHKLISRADVAIYIWGANATWLLFPLLGLYVSIRLIVDGDYSVLGYR